MDQRYGKTVHPKRNSHNPYSFEKMINLSHNKVIGT